MVGYDIPSKTYRYFDPLTHKTCISRCRSYWESSFIHSLSSQARSQPTPSLKQLFPFTLNTPPLPVLPPSPSLPPPATDSNFSSSSYPAHTPPPPLPTPSHFPSLTTNLPKHPPLRRSSRQPLFPRHLDDFVGITECLTAVTFYEALHHPCWVLAMQIKIKIFSHFQYLATSQTTLDTPIISCRWVFTIKIRHSGMPDQYKACLIARNCQQNAGIDYDETYTPIAKWNTLRTTAVVDVHRGWPILHMDIKTTYLWSYLAQTPPSWTSA